MVPAVAGEHSGERPAAGTPNAEALVGSPLRLGATCDTLVAAAAAEGFVVAATGPNRFRMAKSWRPRWARVLMWLLLPVAGLGLVFLLIRRSATLDASVDEEIATALRECEAAPPVACETLMDDVYARRPAHLEAQREELLRYPRAHTTTTEPHGSK